MTRTLLLLITTENTLQGIYWTSGTDLKKDGNFEWCTTSNQMPVNASWAPGMPATPTGTHGSCVQVTLKDGTVQLQNALCTNTLPFICEVNYNFSHLFIFSFYVNFTRHPIQRKQVLENTKWKNASCFITLLTVCDIFTRISTKFIWCFLF